MLNINKPNQTKMRIKKLTFKNFKGRTREIDLGTINVVHGPNWSGKTAVLSAIRVGLLGYDPKLGKRPGDTFQLATGDNMEVALAFDDVTLKRAWRSVRGSVKTEIAGVPPPVPSMLLDVRDYFGLTAQQRRDHVLSMLDLQAAGLSDDLLLAKIKTVTVDGHDAEAEAEVGEISEEFDFWCCDRDENQSPLVEWMAGNVTRIKERIGRHETEGTQCAALLQTIAQERAATPGGVPQNQESMIGKLQSELEAMAQSYGAQTASAGRWMQRQEIEKQLSAMTDLTSERERLKADLDEARMEADAVAITPGASPLELRTAQSRLDAVRGMHSQIAGQYNALEAKFLSESKFDKCPTCGSEEHVPAMKKKLKKDFDIAAKTMLDNVKTLAGQIAGFEVELNKLTKESEAAAESSKGVETLRTRVRIAEVAFEHVQRHIQSRENLAASLKGYADAADPGDLTAITDQMMAVRHKIEECCCNQKSRTLLLEREAQGADAEQRKASAEVRQSVAKACLKAIQGAQQAAIDGAFGPFLATVRKFTDGVLDFALEYRDGDVGYVRDGTWVSHSTFSGSEMALTYAGLGVALAQRSPIKIVMLDEVLLTPKTKRLLALRMGQLIDEGVIDQVVVVDVSDADWQECAPTATFIEAK